MSNFNYSCIQDTPNGRSTTTSRVDGYGNASSTSGALEVRVTQSRECFACSAGESVLRGMLRLGRRGIPVGCVGGGCGICKVRILEGRVTRLGPISRAHVSAEEEAAGLTLACRVTPVTALHLELAGYMANRFSRSGAATEVRTVESTKGDDKWVC